MKYGELTLGHVEAIVNKLGGMEGVERFLSGELVVVRTECKFGVWKTIKLGTGLETAEGFRRVLSVGGFKVSDWASDIMGKAAFAVSAEVTEVDLVRVTVGELGFKNSAGRDQIYARADKLGLELCPAEVSPQLRLQYKDQPNGEWILVAMEPVFDFDGNPDVFVVGRDASELWLSAVWSHPAHVWHPDDQWLFVRPRK